MKENNVAYNFWKKWKEASELERERIIETLPFVIHMPQYLKAYKGKNDLLVYSIASQINQYLCDFEEYLISERMKRRNL